MKHRYLVIHGPNLNLLGTREPGVYGADTLEEINRRLAAWAAVARCASCASCNPTTRARSIDALHEARAWAEGIVINPGAYTHYSYALRDAIGGRGPARHRGAPLQRPRARRVPAHSVIAPVCRGQIVGLGWIGYLLALEALREN